MTDLEIMYKKWNVSKKFNKSRVLSSQKTYNVMFDYWKKEGERRRE